MHRYLSEHPEIYVTDRKGLHYFTYPDLAANVAGPGDAAAIHGFCQTLEEYAAHYSAVENQKAIGDNSPSYLYYAHCIPKIQDTLGDQVRIIAMVRNPIDRAFSNYQHLVRTKRETLSFYDALQAEEERTRNHWGDFWHYRGHSLYYAKVKPYIDAFGADRVMVVVQDDLERNTLDVVQAVYRFLQVDDTFAPGNVSVVYGKGGAVNTPLGTVLGRPGRWKVALKSLLPRPFYRRLRNAKDAYISRNTVQVDRPDPLAVAWLKPHFAEDIVQLETLLRRGLDAWK